MAEAAQALAGPEPAGSLDARGITQRFGGAKALDSVDFSVAAGTVHALLGENGAGKSTLVKVLTGALVPDDGTLVLDGSTVHFRTPRQSIEAGIGVVHQDFQLFNELSVAENVFSASPSLPRRRSGLADRRTMVERSHDLLESLGIDIDARARVGDLDAAERKLVEISRALLRSPRYLILDEPTAALEPRETVRLLQVIGRLRERGTGVILVTHRLGEVVEIADHATVLRNGLLVGTIDRGEITPTALARMIVGQDVAGHDGPTHEVGGPVLELTDLVVRAEARPVSLVVHARELVALIGLIGSGVPKVLETVAGLDRQRTGRLTVRGEDASFRNRRAAQRLGIACVPIDRKASGLVVQSSIATNIGLASLSQSSTAGFSSRRRLRAVAEESRALFDIRCSSVDQAVGDLSGGNQQKVMLGRWHANGSSILVIDEPSQGVDIGARHEIHQYLLNFTASGGAVLFASSDLEEVHAIAHRIYVMHAGEIVAEFSNVGANRPTRSDLTQAMTGTTLSSVERDLIT